MKSRFLIFCMVCFVMVIGSAVQSNAEALTMEEMALMQGGCPWNGDCGITWGECYDLDSGLDCTLKQCDGGAASCSYRTYRCRENQQTIYVQYGCSCTAH
jgi:hypothetical protein